jgi:hypothetical protein
MHDDVRPCGVQAAADGGAEALGATGDEHAVAGEGRGCVHGVTQAIVRMLDGATIPESLRRVATAGFAR